MSLVIAWITVIPVYFMVIFFMALMYLLPLVAIALNRNFADVRYIDFFPPFLSDFSRTHCLRFYWRRTKTYRPVDAKIVSWENTMFVFARWPWSLAGCLASVRDHVTGVFVDFKITPKGTTYVDYPPSRVQLPYVFLSLLSAVVAAFMPAGGAAAGFYIFAIFNAVIYALLVAVIVGGMCVKIASLPFRGRAGQLQSCRSSWSVLRFPPMR